MIFFVLFLGLVLRLVNLGQSLWLDEAVQAITAKGPFLGIFEELRGDFHPPLYHLFLWVWVHLFGSKEIILRLPSVIFGVGTIYISYKIISGLTDSETSRLTNLKINGLADLRIKKVGLLGALFLATSQFHIYYSQEARMYALSCFLTSLSMYYFIKLLKNSEINGLKNYIFYVVFSVFALYSDYYALLVILAQIVAGIIILRKRIVLLLYCYIAMLLLFLPLMPLLIPQLKTGLEATTILPAWGRLVNLSLWKALPLTFLKFSLGRITIFNKVLYAAVALVLFLIYGFAIIKGFFRGKKLLITDHRLLIAFWLIIPVFFAWFFSLIIPNFQPFRLLLVLPAFWILLTLGIFKIESTKIRQVLIFLVLVVNLVSLVSYWFNPYFWREDWRGVANYLKKESLPIVISSSAFNWPLIYYGVGNNLVVEVARGVRPVQENDKNYLINQVINNKIISYTPYLGEIYDPQKKIPQWLEEAGFDKIKEISFNQIPVWVYRSYQ